jgi:hypothetical protein
MRDSRMGIGRRRKEYEEREDKREGEEGRNEEGGGWMGMGSVEGREKEDKKGGNDKDDGRNRESIKKGGEE